MRVEKLTLEARRVAIGSLTGMPGRQNHFYYSLIRLHTNEVADFAVSIVSGEQCPLVAHLI